MDQVIPGRFIYPDPEVSNDGANLGPIIRTSQREAEF
jgi:hypothetical protein